MIFFYKPGDILLYLLLAAGSLFPLFVSTDSNQTSTLVEVSAGRSQSQLLSRNSDSTYSFPTFQLQIKSGSCRIINSTCSDHLCEKMGWLDSSSSGRIICLPHKIIIKNKFNKPDAVDEISE